MSADDFFSRWSKRAAESKAPVVPAQEAHAETKHGNPAEDVKTPAPPPIQHEVTLEDVAALTKDSDYAPFMAKGIDETVKRSAMKKLFSEPHFNVMDGLDIYIDDYSVFEPVTPAVLGLMEHAKPLLDPLKQLQNPVLSLLQEANQEKEQAQAVGEDQDKTDGPVTAEITEQPAEQETTQGKETDDSEEALAQKKLFTETPSSPTHTSE